MTHMKSDERRVGRPLAKKPRVYKLTVRLNKDEAGIVEDICERYELTQADLIRSMIKWAKKHSEWVELCLD